MAWAEAAVREGRPTGLAPPAEATRPPATGPAELLRVLPPEGGCPRRSSTCAPASTSTDLVGGLPGALAAAACRLSPRSAGQSRDRRSWARLASIAARAVPAEVLNHPITREPTGEEDTWRRRLVETLIFRREMYEELS